jgi:hypothetical protein
MINFSLVFLVLFINNVCREFSADFMTKRKMTDIKWNTTEIKTNVIPMRKDFQVRFISCEFIDYKLLISIGVIRDALEWSWRGKSLDCGLSSNFVVIVWNFEQVAVHLSSYQTTTVATVQQTQASSFPYQTPNIWFNAHWRNQSPNQF